MRFGVHLLSFLLTLVLVTVLTHEQHMRLSALLITLAFLGFGTWMVGGTLWWLIGLVFRREAGDGEEDGEG